MPTVIHDRHGDAVARDLAERHGISSVLLALAQHLGLIRVTGDGRAGFVRRNAAGQEAGIETVPDMMAPSATDGFWMSWDADWPAWVILAGNAIEALSILSLHPVPTKHESCVVVSTGSVTQGVPAWIEAWSPTRIFCAWPATRNSDRAARHLQRYDTRVVRMRPALNGQSWNDMLLRSRHGEPIGTIDIRID